MIKDSVLSILLRYTNSQYKKDSNYDLAWMLLKYYNDIPDMTINELADKCYVSNSTLSRFTKNIGFESFLEFKEACRNTLKIMDTDYSLAVSKAKKEDIQPIFSRYTKHVIDNIQFVYDHLDYHQLDRITQKMNESENIAMLGMEFSTLLGQHFQNRLALVNKYVKIGLTYDDQLNIVETINGPAVVFIASIEGGYFYRNDEIMKKLLSKNNIYIVVLTMNLQNKLIKEANEVVLCSKENSDTEGRISLLYIIELIIMYYCINYSH